MDFRIDEFDVFEKGDIKESDIKAWENMDKKSDINAWENFHSTCVGKI